MSNKYQNLPIPSSSDLPPNIKIRPATSEDASAMASVYFSAWNPSHRFWQALLPDTAKNRQWWVDAWKLGIENDPTARTFVAIDTAPDAIEKVESKTEDGSRLEGSAFKGKDGEIVVGISRWIVPQEDGNLERPWPDMTDEIDMDLAGPFFGGMEHNREQLMEKRPHWMLEMLGTSPQYQGQGIGIAFLKWGCELADKDDLEVYIDASEKGAPFYQKSVGAEPKADIPLPERNGPGEYGRYTYISHVRPPISTRS